MHQMSEYANSSENSEAKSPDGATASATDGAPPLLGPGFPPEAVGAIPKAGGRTPSAPILLRRARSSDCNHSRNPSPKEGPLSTLATVPWCFSKARGGSMSASQRFTKRLASKMCLHSAPPGSCRAAIVWLVSGARRNHGMPSAIPSGTKMLSGSLAASFAFLPFAAGPPGPLFPVALPALSASFGLGSSGDFSPKFIDWPRVFCSVSYTTRRFVRVSTCSRCVTASL
mmetsp:Transcript_53099/g.163450  ORF Transcript_53099/g.163450 Transcript_53099/m.163450 type:complete len:228 (-) Transcript_53099:1040-1723(-)